MLALPYKRFIYDFNGDFKVRTTATATTAAAATSDDSSGSGEVCRPLYLRFPRDTRDASAAVDGDTGASVSQSKS